MLKFVLRVSPNNSKYRSQNIQTINSEIIQTPLFG